MNTCEHCGANLDWGEKCDCHREETVPASISVTRMETIAVKDVDVKQELITIKQLPVIAQRLAIVGKEIEEKTQAALSMECTEETVKTVKTMRADLKRDSTALQENYKKVEAAVFAPWNEFKCIYKGAITDKYASADEILRQRIVSVEDELKAKKEAGIKDYFAEYAQSIRVDFVPYERAGINVTLTASPKSLKEAARNFLDRIRSDLDLIDTQADKAEILVEYRKTLNCSLAITQVSARHRAIAQANARIEAEQQAAAADQAVIEKVEAAAPEHVPLVAPVELEQVYPVYLKFELIVPELIRLKHVLEKEKFNYEQCQKQRTGSFL